jgi:hypothetical protein
MVGELAESHVLDRVSTRILSTNDFQSILELRNQVISELADPDHYQREEDEESFVFDHLGSHGRSIGYWYQDRLVGYAALTLDPARVLFDFEGVSRIDLSQCASLSAAMVLRDFRGLGIQRHSIMQRFRMAAAANVLNLIAMVSPNNIASLYNLSLIGMVAADLVTFPDGRTRLIMQKNGLFERRSPEINAPMLLPYQNIAEARALIDHGKVGLRFLCRGQQSLWIFGSPS